MVNFLRLIGVGLATFFTGTLGFGLFLITWNRELQCRFTRTVWSPTLLAIGGVRLRIEHESPIPWDKPHIYICNHQSAVDIPAAFVAIPVNLRFIAKAVLRFVPFLGTYMVMTGMVFVDRGNHHRALRSMRKAARRIREGNDIIAFPEGTRSSGDDVLPFKKGVFVLAMEAGVPVVPCAMHGGFQVLPPGYRIRPGLIRFRTGRPIPTHDVPRHEQTRLIEHAHREVTRMYREISDSPQGPCT